MRDRLQKEYELLKKFFPETIAQEIDGNCWFRIANFVIKGDLWDKQRADACFEAKVSYPSTPPYSFYIQGGLRTKVTNERPKDYEEPAQTPFEGIWGRFSWQHENWCPTDDLVSGSNLLNFVRTFADRIGEGI